MRPIQTPDKDLGRRLYKLIRGTSVASSRKPYSPARISYGPSGPQEGIGGLANVVITSPQNGDILVYVAATGTWINQAP
jgi:hypothetical protein